MAGFFQLTKMFFMRGGRRSTTWTKGTAPKKKQGAKAFKTLLKESLGLNGWEKLRAFIANEGSEKMVESLLEMSDKDFVQAYTHLLEFVRPKLSRTTHAGDPNSPLELRTGIDLDKLTPEEQLALYKYASLASPPRIQTVG